MGHHGHAAYRALQDCQELLVLDQLQTSAEPSQEITMPNRLVDA
jgi:hypothetical protein